jgi:tetratricopeptide (TPR) repeat protein
MGDTVNAMRDYQAAIRLEPDYSLAYYNAANLYFKQRQFQQVRNVFTYLGVGSQCFHLTFILQTREGTKCSCFRHCPTMKRHHRGIHKMKVPF